MWFLTKVFSSNVTIKAKGLKGWRTYTSLSYIHNIGKEPLRAMTIGNLVESAVKKYPDREAIISVSQNKRLTHQEVLTQADKLAAGLRTLGIQKGDRIGIWSPNLAEWIITATAIARIGCISVAINPAYKADEMKFCINKVGIKALVCPSKIKKTNFYETLNAISPTLQKAEPGKLNCFNVPTLESIITISDETLKGTLNYNEVLELADETTIKSIKSNQHLITPDSIYSIQFTSGTTGKPKATKLSHFAIVNNSFNVGKRNELDRKHHKICIQVPFFHAYGITIAIGSSFHFGSTMVLPSTVYNVKENLKALEDEKCSVVYGTPTMYVDLINLKKQEKADINLEIAVSGGSSCSPKLFEEMQEILKVKKVKSVYGLTESTAVAFQSLPVEEDAYKATSTVGYLLDHLEAKVVDADGHIVPLETPGELCIRGYSVMQGYWGDEVNTKKVMGVDGWLKTGDQFVLQEDGYGRIVGRLKDIIIRGGENIFPKEIEDFLITHPDILECQIIGLSHERLGEEVCACVRLKKGTELTHKSLVEFCKGKMADFKIPSQLRIVDSYPKTESGKIKKNVLKEQMEKFTQKKLR